MKYLLFVLALSFFSFAYSQKYDLKFNLEENQDYWQSNSSTMYVTQKINGRNSKSKVVIDGLIKFHVNKLEDSVYDIDADFESLSFKLASDVLSMNYSSEDNSDEILSKVYKAMTKQPFTVKMTEKGKIKSMDISKVFEHSMEQFSSLSDGQKQIIMDQLKQIFGEKTFIANFEMITALFPNKPVKQGEKWLIRNRLQSIMNVDLSTIYQLKTVTDTSYIIDGECKIVSNPSNFSMFNGMPTKAILDGRMKYATVVDKRTGWITSASINQSFGGTIEIRDNEKIPGGMIIPTTYITEIIIGTHQQSKQQN